MRIRFILALWLFAHCTAAFAAEPAQAESDRRVEELYTRRDLSRALKSADTSKMKDFIEKHPDFDFNATSSTSSYSAADMALMDYRSNLRAYYTLGPSYDPKMKENLEAVPQILKLMAEKGADFSKAQENVNRFEQSSMESMKSMNGSGYDDRSTNWARDQAAKVIATLPQNPKPSTAKTSRTAWSDILQIFKVLPSPSHSPAVAPTTPVHQAIVPVGAAPDPASACGLKLFHSSLRNSWKDTVYALESDPKLKTLTNLYETKEGECSLSLTYRAVRVKNSKDPQLVVEDVRINGSRSKDLPSEVVQIMSDEPSVAKEAK